MADEGPPGPHAGRMLVGVVGGSEDADPPEGDQRRVSGILELGQHDRRIVVVRLGRHLEPYRQK